MANEDHAEDQLFQESVVGLVSSSNKKNRSRASPGQLSMHSNPRRYTVVDMVDFKLKSQVTLQGLGQRLTTDYAIKEVDEESAVLIGTPKHSGRNSLLSLPSGERHSLNASQLDRADLQTNADKLNTEPKNPLVQIEIAPNDSYWGQFAM